MNETGQHGAHLDFSQRMSYGDYLTLDQLLSAQNPLTDRHDEMLFVIQHQVSELWMKLVLHELNSARERIKLDDIPPALKMLARVTRTFEQLISAWTVLTTLTPSEYESFRDALGQSSGFQSFQYRMIEFILGNKDPKLIEPHRHHPARFAGVSGQLALPSIYDETVRILSRNGLPIDQECLERDWTKPHQHNATIESAWLVVYGNPAKYWSLYELAEKLVDVEDAFRQWRFRHVTTVERIIGFKTGTGGTAGVSYLKKMLDTVLFPELWRVRTKL